MLTALKQLLLRFPPETAHRLAIGSLKAYGVGGCRGTSPTIQVSTVPSLRFVNRVGIAAGFDKNAEVIPGLARLGFGFLEVGTVTPLPQPGNPKPRIFRISPSALINRLGFNNCGLEEFRRNLTTGRARVSIPVLANIGRGKDTPNESALEDYALGFRHLGEVADGFVVNVSSPNTKGLRDLQTEAFLSKLAAILPREKPTFLKLAPDLSDTELKELCLQVAKERFSGVVLTNTSRALAQGAGHDAGGFSGPPLFERSLACVTIAADVLKGKKAVIGVGGIDSLERAAQMRKAGADLIEIYTAFIYQGPKLIRELGRLD